MRHTVGRSRLAIVIVAALAASACAARAQHRGVQVAVSVHAAVAAVDDTELALFNSGAIAADVHRAANTQIVKALKAGKAFDAGVRAWPADGAITKEQLGELTSALAALAEQVGAFGSAEAQQRLSAGIIAAQQAILLAASFLL